MRRRSSIGVLLIVLILFGGLALIASRDEADGAGGADSGAAPLDTAQPDVSGDASTATAPPGEASGTAETTEAPAPLEDTADPGAPVTIPPPAAIAMPASSQFESVALRIEPTVEIPDLTGMIWNNREGAYYAITQDGTVHKINRELTDSEMVLDLRDETTELLAGSERGMLGITFDPRDGRMFLYFTDRGDDSNVISMEMDGGKPDPSTRRNILFIEQPGVGHKAGDMLFDDNGHLFVTIGDGGGSRGRDAQDDSKLLGTIIRIIPKLDAEGYDIPADNPFVGQEGKRGEIWANGLRNPWQFSLDPASGDMYIGDVGESDIEELDKIPAGTSGQNFGWYWFEGSNDRGTGEMPEGTEVTPPIFEYPHSLGPAIIGGTVYYGSAIPELQGSLVFADMTGPIFAMGSDQAVRLGINGSGVITTFVETPERELLMTTLSDGVLRLLPA